MRVLLSLTALLLVGCVTQPRSLSGDYRAAINLLESDQHLLALSKAERGLSRARQAKDLTFEWRFRLLKAEILLAQRKPSAALAVLDEDPPDRPEWAEARGKTLLLRAFAAYIMARYAEAEDLLNRAAERAHQSDSNGLATEIELRRALLLVKQVRFHEAEASLRRVIKEASALQEFYLEATATGNLGYTLLTAARFDEAIIWLERARMLHTQLHANESVARDDGNLGTCYYRLGDYDKARLYYEHAQTGFARASNQFEEQIWTGNDGNVLEDTGRYTEAKAAFRHALQVARQVPNDDWASRWLTDLANNAIQLQDWDAAEQYNNEALALKRSLGNTLFEASSLLNAGRIALGRGQLAKAESLFRSTMSGPAEDPSVALEAHTGLADVYVQSHRTVRADAEFRITVSTIERLSSKLIKDDYRFAYLASLIRFYRKYVDFLVANHQSQRALEVAESSRSHVLAQRSGRPTPAQSHAAKAYQKLAQQAQAVLLEYWLGENQSYLWVITAERIGNYTLPPAKTIRALVEAYRNIVLGQRNPLDAAGDVGRKLYDTLVAPAAEDLCAGCRVILVPDEDLYSLNFESFPASSDRNKFWIEEANVEIAPSLDYLVDTSRHPYFHKGKGLLLMGDPAQVLQEYPRLEFAAREIDSIRSTMGDSDSKVLRGPEARPDSYVGTQPGSFEFIHFSAHAAANTQSPLDSAVILSGPADRCKLFARDVMSVPLSAELVTISACRSAGAKTYAGEGPVGFAWAFLRAGARNVIAGLWDLNDRSTAQLMSGLYAEIARGSTPADALRAAKLSLVRGGGSYAKPYYWAPFQVYTGVIN
jgi:CHAT domain-containing protein/Tfp pilus assembly protein PilF